MIVNQMCTSRAHGPINAEIMCSPRGPAPASAAAEEPEGNAGVCCGEIQLMCQNVFDKRLFLSPHRHDAPSRMLKKVILPRSLTLLETDRWPDCCDLFPRRLPGGKTNHLPSVFCPLRLELITVEDVEEEVGMF